jgi:hypothetical protein
VTPLFRSEREPVLFRMPPGPHRRSVERSQHLVADGVLVSHQADILAVQPGWEAGCEDGASERRRALGAPRAQIPRYSMVSPWTANDFEWISTSCRVGCPVAKECRKPLVGQSCPLHDRWVIEISGLVDVGEEPHLFFAKYQDGPGQRAVPPLQRALRIDRPRVTTTAGPLAPGGDPARTERAQASGKQRTLRIAFAGDNARSRCRRAARPGSVGEFGRW